MQETISDPVKSIWWSTFAKTVKSSLFLQKSFIINIQLGCKYLSVTCKNKETNYLYFISGTKYSQL